MAIPYKNFTIKRPSTSMVSINRWHGINCKENIADTELADMNNMFSDGVNIFTRPSREIVLKDIENPQKIFFCGDKLSYIANGTLYVKSGDEFKKIGSVGNVTSVVDFNNKEMLFYPGNFVYNYEKDEITEANSYLIKKLGCYQYSDELETDYFTDQDEIYNSAYMVQGQNSREYSVKVASMVIQGSDNDPYIYASKIEDSEQYNTITINVTGHNSEFIESGSYHMKLFVHGWNEKGEPMWNMGSKKIYYREFSFGEPILFDGVAPAKITAQIGYYRNRSLNGYNYVDPIPDEQCINQRDTDIASEDFKLWVTATSYPATNSRPIIKYACMDNNRVIGVEGNNFYASSLGNYTNWTDFVDADGNPKATGSYGEELYSYGDFTGIVKFRNTVIITKKNSIYECYGNKPPYRINLAANTGCIDDKSIVNVGGTLYFLGTDGIYRYSGGLPVNISDKINESFGRFLSGCGGTDGKRYYIYVTAEKQSALLVYDTVTGIWCKEDGAEFCDITDFDKTVYALSKDGVIYKFHSGEEDISWEFVTKTFDLNSSAKKILQKLTLEVDSQLNGRMDIYIKYDNGEYIRVASYSTFKTGIVDIRLRNKVCDRFSIKIKGTGNVKILSLSCNCISSNKTHNKDYLVRY